MRIAIFGRPGGGKSTLAQQIAAELGLPLHLLDALQFASGGARQADEPFERLHAALLEAPHWVIEGFGTLRAFERLVAAAELLIWVERPLALHYWWVTKRLLKSPWAPPVGWPRRSPMLRSTWSSYRYLLRGERFWTPALKARLQALEPAQRFRLIRHQADVRALLRELAPVAA
ncbi:adenylate kinase [Roseateles sp. DAIF2]|uniref:AAA family ATPase n=1 Tax=Roseateles sp. DAIF2 TaxID=2714952 RepID=UPI0018A2C35E|nr:AAA family ATPase [Roseateles sp. DAIF2]QPF73967.1 adenylate kinase [Roseateles sp. DAIF2]